MLKTYRHIIVFIYLVVCATFVIAGDPPSLQEQAASVIQNGWKAFEEDKKPDEALIHFNHAILLDGQSGKAYFAAGYVSQATNKPDAAIEYYTKSLEFQPDYASTHMNMGTIMLRKGKVDESFQLFERARTLAPERGQIYVKLALWHFLNEQFPEAWDAIKEARIRQAAINEKFLEALKQQLPEPK